MKDLLSSRFGSETLTFSVKEFGSKIGKLKTES